MRPLGLPSKVGKEKPTSAGRQGNLMTVSYGHIQVLQKVAMLTNLYLPTTQPAFNISFVWQMYVNPLSALTQLAHQSGDTARLHLRQRDLYLLHHPDFIEQVLVKQEHKFVKGNGLQRTKIILGEGLLTSEGEQHRAQRQALQPSFQRQHIEQYLPLMMKSAQDGLAQWQDDQRLDMADEMMRLTLDIALWSFFGHAPEGAGERVSQAMKTLIRLFPLTMLPIPEATRSRFPRFKQASADLDLVTEALIANPRSDLARNALIQILKQNTGGQFTDEQIRAHVLTFMLAGHETTALLLAWAWELLAHDPQAQGKLQAEVDCSLSDRLPTAEDLKQLTYTQAVVKETLRLRPPAWVVGRQAIEDCQIGGYTIPAGSNVLMSQWVMHHDPRFYYQPELFRPERWLEPFGAALPRFAYFPFGGGSRVCIGEHFARTEAVAVLAYAVRRWQVSPVSAKLAKPNPSVTLRPRNGIPLRVEKREN